MESQYFLLYLNEEFFYIEYKPSLSKTKNINNHSKKPIKLSAHFILRFLPRENNLKVSSVLQSQLALKHLNFYLVQGEFS